MSSFSSQIVASPPGPRTRILNCRSPGCPTASITKLIGRPDDMSLVGFRHAETARSSCARDESLQVARHHGHLVRVHLPASAESAVAQTRRCCYRSAGYNRHGYLQLIDTILHVRNRPLPACQDHSLAAGGHRGHLKIGAIPSASRQSSRRPVRSSRCRRPVPARPP